MADPDRKGGGGGLSMRTLAIASAASLTAAIVSSRLFPPGTIYTAALTPVIVAAVSEMLNRPVDRVAQLREQRRTLVMEAARAPEGEEAAALRGAPEFAQGADAEELTVSGNGTGDAPPIRVHRPARPRYLHPKVWLVTGALAFLIAVAVVTLPELVFGGAVANNHRTTIFGGGSSSSGTKTQTTETKTQTQPQTTVTETVPAQTPSQTTETQTTTTETQTTPTETQTTPTETSTTPTETTTTPGGAAVPPTP